MGYTCLWGGNADGCFSCATLYKRHGLGVEYMR